MRSENSEITGHSMLCRCCFKRISWSAIIVGALVGVGISFLFALFSIAIGLSIVTTTAGGALSLAIGGFIGLVISAIVSMFVAGTAAGYLGRAYCPKRNLGVLYGFTTWCFALILTVTLASSMGRYISTYSDFISNPTTITLPHDRYMPAIAQQTTPSTALVVVNASAPVTHLGNTAFLTFVLFFVGAIASCFGGHFGMMCDEENCKQCCSIETKP